MISLEDLRQELIGTFQTVHNTAQPNMLVNYPNLFVVDIERQKDPFISVEFDFSGLLRAAIGEREILVPGFLNIYYYYRIGTGTADAVKYTDMLNTQLGMSQIGSIAFKPVKPMEIQSFPGWVGMLNSIGFDVVASLLDTTPTGDPDLTFGGDPDITFGGDPDVYF